MIQTTMISAGLLATPYSRDAISHDIGYVKYKYTKIDTLYDHGLGPVSI